MKTKIIGYSPDIDFVLLQYVATINDDYSSSAWWTFNTLQHLRQWNKFITFPDINLDRCEVLQGFFRVEMC